MKYSYLLCIITFSVATKTIAHTHTHTGWVLYALSSLFVKWLRNKHRIECQCIHWAFIATTFWTWHNLNMFFGTTSTHTHKMSSIVQHLNVKRFQKNLFVLNVTMTRAITKRNTEEDMLSSLRHQCQQKWKLMHRVDSLCPSLHSNMFPTSYSCSSSSWHIPLDGKCWP